MKYNSLIYVLFLSSILFITCDLERVEIGNGNEIKFQTTIGGSGNETPQDLITTTDGGYIIVGSSSSFSSNLQAYVVKLNKQGTQVWENNIGGTGSDAAFGALETSDKGVIICGYTQTSPNNEQNVYIAKFDAAGKTVWEKNYGSPDTLESAYAIAPLSNGDFYVLYVGFRSGTQQINLMRINANGSKVSTRTLRTGFYYAYDMIKSSDNKIVIVGTSYGNSQGTNAYILKVNEDGSFVWENEFSGPIINYTPAYELVELSNKNIVIAGSYLGNNDHDFNLVTYNAIGAKQWDFNWGGAAADELYGVDKTLDNQLIVFGYTGSFSGKTEIYLSKRNASNGNIIWEKNFLNIAVGIGKVRSCNDGGYIVCSKNISGSNGDIIIVKTDANGNYE